MKAIAAILGILVAGLLLSAVFGQNREQAVAVQEQAAEPKASDHKHARTITTHRAWRPVSHAPDGGHVVHFRDRKSMWGKDRTTHFKLDPAKKHAVQLPIDWAKNLSFPMDLNDQYGDCYYAAGCHTDNTYTGNSGTESVFSLSAIRTRYFALSGGDNGLNDSDMQQEMMDRYLADVPAAKIVSWANVDSTDPQACQAAIQKYGVVVFTFTVASNWINNSDTGTVWDASSYRPNNNGHAVIFNGVDTRGYYKLQTWGTYVWLTPAGLNVCEPGAWVAFSARWFNSAGYAPNGQHIVDLAKQWTTDTGKTIQASVIQGFPPPGPTPPGPTPPGPVPPGPTPSPGGMNVVTWTVNGVTSSYELLPLGTMQKLRELRDLIGPLAP